MFQPTTRRKKCFREPTRERERARESERGTEREIDIIVIILMVMMKFGRCQDLQFLNPSRVDAANTGAGRFGE